jgi:hypothetical protein
MKEHEETDWWQEIENFAYCLDGKAPEDWHAMLRRVAAGMLVPDPSGSLEDFKRYAVSHLIQIIAAGPCLCAETDAEFLARYKRIHAAHRRGEPGIVGEFRRAGDASQGKSETGGAEGIRGTIVVCGCDAVIPVFILFAVGAAFAVEIVWILRSGP